MSESSVTRVSTLKAPVCPVYEYVDVGQPITSTVRKTYFSTSSSSLWSSGVPATEVRPCALAADDADLNVGLWFALNDKKSLKPGTDWKLEAIIPLVGGKPAVFKFEGKWDAKYIKDGVVATLVPPQWPSGDGIPLPWALRGDLSWTITGVTSEKDSLVGQGHFATELYVVSKYLQPCMKRDGIPLGLLRYPNLFPKWMTLPIKAKDLPLGWSSFVTAELFRDDRMIYNTWTGVAAYTGSNWEGRSLESEIILWLDLWLSDMYGIIKRQTKERYLVNCNDLSALVTAICSLGLKDSASLLQICDLQEKFFINETFLIGVHYKSPKPKVKDDTCNNPFFSLADKEDPCCSSHDAARRFFSNHAFVVQGTKKEGQDLQTLKPIVGKVDSLKVLDACVGPHTGDEDLPTYIDRAVDNAEAIAWSKDAREMKKDENVRKPVVPIDVSKVLIGAHLEALASRPALVRVVPTANLPKCLYKSMVELFGQGIYTVREPVEGMSDPYSISMVATWTVTKPVLTNGIIPEYHVNISRHFDQDSVQAAYNRKRDTLNRKKSKYVEDGPGKNGLCFTTKGNNTLNGFYMFWIQVDETNNDAGTKQYYLVTIDANESGEVIAVGNDSPGQILRTRLQQLGKEEDVKKKLEIESIQGPATAKKDSEFSVVIKFKAPSATWWRGATGQPTKDCAIIVDVVPNDQENSISMRFRAIKLGKESITLSVFGQNLDVTYKGHAIEITE